MLNETQIILIGNYQPDKIESMDKFAQMLQREFTKLNIKVEIWFPKVFLGRYVRSTLGGFGKWLGYIDKWVFTPFLLKHCVHNKILKNPDVYFHICDHSNAPYLKYLPRERSGITCHDVLAIRGAFGYIDAHCPASSTGKYFQKWILKNLVQAKFLASVSRSTLQQLTELTQQNIEKQIHWKVIHNSFNEDFKIIQKEKVELLLEKTGIDLNKPFVLHVGSGLPRKNRRLLLQMIAVLDKDWTGNICFAGEAIDEQLLTEAKFLNLQERIISVVKPDHDTLGALYNGCEALIFPSFSEGFGWPLIEAQACGAPVIASDIEPLIEISKGSALHANPDNPQQFAKAFLSLKDDTIKFELIEKGVKNTLRFQAVHMINAYLDLFGILKSKLNECAA